MQLSSKVLIKFSAAAVAIVSIVGCGSGSAKPFSAGSAVGSINNSSSGSNSGSSSGSGGNTSNPTSTPTAAPTPGAPPASPDPAGAIVYASLQSQPGWQTCGGCGNQGGAGQGPDYHMAQVSNPSLSGSAADFYVNGGPAYTGGYYFIEQPTIQNPVSYLRYDFDLFVPGQYANAPQAIEFECQQTTNGNTYNFAWQADYASNSWRVFDFTTKQWEDTGIQLQRFAPDTWHHISAVFHAAGTQAIHDSLTVDGRTMGANITHQATNTGTRLEFTAGFQVDLNASSTPYHVYVDNMRVTAND